MFWDLWVSKFTSLGNLGFMGFGVWICELDFRFYRYWCFVLVNVLAV